MARRDMKSALKGSMLSEEKAIETRFEKAEALFAAKSAPTIIETKINAVKPKKAQPAEKVKVIRDSFTMPQTDYDLINLLKKRSVKAGFEITKSEIIRAGLKTLNQMQDNDFLDSLAQIEKVKTGRPKQTV
jgi:hypothetical protein